VTDRILRSTPAEGVTQLTLHRPESLNAFTVADYRELRELLEQSAIDGEVRALVLTGTGRAFSVGADRSVLDGSAADAEQAGDEFVALLDALARFPKPFVAAVNGLAVGFGCTILPYADLVLVASSARLRFPFTQLGITPEAGSSALLYTRMRSQDAMWAVLSSEWIDAGAAVNSGLAWREVEDDRLLAESIAIASSIAAHDPAAVIATKQLMTTGREAIIHAAVDRELAAMQDLRGHTSR
jgi:enoyl-CoA hydratase/carnithine racemase